jgi:hypothetical protein
VNPFAGSCLEALFQCFQPSGAGTCHYDAPSMVASRVYANGAKVTSASGGTEANRCFGPTGSICFTMTKISDTVHNYNGLGQDITVTDNGASLQVQCQNGASQVAKPAANPAEEDLRSCVSSP